MRRLMAGAVVLMLMLAVSQGAYAEFKEGAPLSGKVVETMNGGGYTYVLLEDKGKQAWVAVPQMKVEKGQKVTLNPGMEMRDFQSKSLKRTFKSIYFSTGPMK